MLRRDLAAAYLGMATSTFDNECRAGRVPKPVPITAGLSAWHRQDLEAWAENQRATIAGETNEWDSP